VKITGKFRIKDNANISQNGESIVNLNLKVYQIVIIDDT